MSASVGLRLQLMMDNEGNYQEMKAARSSTQVTCRNYGNKKKKIAIFPDASTSAASGGQSSTFRRGPCSE